MLEELFGTYKTIIGFLSGSIATLVVKEIISQYNKHTDFKRELTKATYLRKMEKAENAVAYYWTYHSRTLEIKKSLEVILKIVNDIEETKSDADIIQEILDKHTKAIDALSTSTYASINSVHLYFDLGDAELWNENDVESSLTALAETKAIDKQISFWTSLYNSHSEKGEEEQAQYCWNQMLEVLPQYSDSLQKLIFMIEKERVATQSIVANIKKQLKRY